MTNSEGEVGVVEDDAEDAEEKEEEEEEVLMLMFAADKSTDIDSRGEKRMMKGDAKERR